MTLKKRLSSVVGPLGICRSIAAVAISFLVDVVANAFGGPEAETSVYLGVSKAVVALVLCYLSVSVVLTTKDDFRLVIPYVEFARQVRGVRPLVIDTSSLIDGRIDAVGQAGFIDAPILLPAFVLRNCRAADSEDRQKRLRGRRGLDMVAKPSRTSTSRSTTPGRTASGSMPAVRMLDQEFDPDQRPQPPQDRGSTGSAC